MLLCVGGPPRSGTELMRQILNRITSVHIAPETHIFGDLLARLNCGPHATLEGEELQKAINYFRALEEVPYGQHEAFLSSGIGQTKFLESTDAPTVASLYEAYCRRSAYMAGLPSPIVWGDKTPRHVFAIDFILEHFPNSRFLVMVRDPRAVVLSYRDWQNRWFEGKDLDTAQQTRISEEELRARRSYHPITIALLWRAAARAGCAAAARYPDQVRLVRFEDIIHDPEKEVRAICHWLGLSFDEAALHVGHLNSSFVGRRDAAGFDRISLVRWQTGLNDSEKWMIERLAGPAFLELSFRPSETSPSLIRIISMTASFVPAVVSAAWVNRGRRGNLLKFLKERIRHL